MTFIQKIHLLVAYVYFSFRMLDEEGQQETLEVLLATSLCGIGMAYLLQGMTEKVRHQAVTLVL